MKRTAKILIVDDAELIGDILEQMLRGHGINDITRAENGAIALGHFRDALQSGTPYSLVLLDIVMPELDGQETLKQLRKIERNGGIGREQSAVIIMNTILHSPSDMLDAMIDGDCTDYMVKPFGHEYIGGMLVKYGFL